MKDLVQRLNKEADFLSSILQKRERDTANLLREAAKALTPEPVFYKDQPILHGLDKDVGYYSHKGEDGLHYYFADGKTSRTTLDTFSTTIIKPDPTAHSLMNWIMNTGVKPDTDKKIIGVQKDESLFIGVVDDFVWDLSKEHHTIKYAILEG